MAAGAHQHVKGKTVVRFSGQRMVLPKASLQLPAQVVEVDDPVLVGAAPFELELGRGRTVFEQARAGAQRQRVDEQVQVVDQPVGQQARTSGCCR